MATIRERIALRALEFAELVTRSGNSRPGRQEYGGRFTQGGALNRQTGLGNGLDKTESTIFTPTRFWWRAPLELLYVQSSAAAKFVNMPIDDMFIRWRTWIGDDVNAIEAMTEAEQRHKVRSRLNKVMKSARLYGTSIHLRTQEILLHETLH